MNRSELALVMATSGSISKPVADRVLDAALEAIARELAAGGRVTLASFGSFRFVARKARTGRDPRTGGKIHIAPRNSVQFALSRELKATLNPGAAAPPAQAAAASA